MRRYIFRGNFESFNLSVRESGHYAGRQLDVEQAAANQKNRYNDFLMANAEKEVFDLSTPNWLGRKQLVDQLNNGVFGDVPFGKIPKDLLAKTNAIRLQNKVMPLGEDIIIPGGVVQKWNSNRLTEGYTPDEVGRIADNVYHTIGNIVSEGRYPHIQKIISPQGNNNYIGFISGNGNCCKNNI